ncbi:MAG: trypsin-like peptidase domain-containing protein [Chloroflexi bacterium]|nr:trypsin-like peptidase domain-containing protein [Chloroflexota bacterium]
MKRKIALLIVLTAMLVVAMYAGTFISTSKVSAAAQPATAGLQPAPLAAPKFGTVSDFESSLINIYSQVSPSVVAIDVVESRAASPNLPQNHPNFGPGQATALGSGFVWDTSGHIVTNNHVVDGATQIQVTFSDGSSAAAKIVASDPDSDLAVISVSVPANQLKPVQIADSTQVKVGQFAIAIGNPYGEQNTMTTGIISALGRSLPVANSSSSVNGFTQGPSYSIPDVIQTDTPINPGNSGGVLLNSEGKLIGVTSAIESPSGVSAGIGFAIPSTIVQKVVPALITNGRYSHPYIGISGTTVGANLAQAMGLKPNQRGALVVTVIPNGPAAKAGLRGSSQQTTINGLQAQIGGDVVTAIDGKPVKSFDDIVTYLAGSTTVNQTVTLTILRDSKEQQLQVTLAARPNSTGQ